MKRKFIVALCIIFWTVSINVYAIGRDISINDNGSEVMFTGSATEHYLILSSGGVVSAWGKNDYGQCAKEPSESHENINYIDFNTENKIVDVKAGGDFSLALDDSGQVWAWGNNKNCQLGISWPTDTADFSRYYTEPHLINTAEKIIAIEAGTDFSLFLTESGDVLASGGGYGKCQNKIRFPEMNGNATEIKKISARGNNIIAVDKNNFIYQWKYLSGGFQTLEIENQPVIGDISAGEDHVVIAVENGNDLDIYTWGRNLNYQLGMEDRNVYVEEPVKVLTIPEMAERSFILNTGKSSTYISVYDSLGKNDDIYEYCFGTGCYYMSETYDEYGKYYDGFENDVQKTPHERKVSRSIIAIGDEKNVSYRVDDAIEFSGKGEEPSAIHIIESEIPVEPMYKYQYENVEYNTINVNFVKLNKDKFDDENVSKDGFKYQYWEYLNEHQLRVKIKDFIDASENEFSNLKYGVLSLSKDITAENKIIEGLVSLVWDFDSERIFFEGETQEIIHGKEDGLTIEVSAKKHINNIEELNIPDNVEIFYGNPGEIAEDTKLGLYVYGLPDGVTAQVKNISGNRFELGFEGNSNTDLDYDSHIKICYVYAIDDQYAKGTIGDYDLENVTICASDSELQNVVIKSTGHTPELLNISADITKGKENNKEIEATIAGGEFNVIQEESFWALIGCEDVEISRVEYVDKTHVKLILKGNSKDKYEDTNVYVSCCGKAYNDSRSIDESSGEMFGADLKSDNSVVFSKQRKNSGGGGYLVKSSPKPSPIPTSTALPMSDSTDKLFEMILKIGEKTAQINGENVENDVAPVIKNNRAMIPVRFIAENLGATVKWLDEKKEITITKDNDVILLYVGADKMYVNDKTISIDTPVFIENDRAYVAIRFIAENLGTMVEWDREKQEILINNQK